MSNSISYLTYLLVFISLIGHVGVGNLLLKSTNLITQSLVGLLFSASIVSLLAWTFPLYIKPFIISIITLGYIFLLLNVKNLSFNSLLFYKEIFKKKNEIIIFIFVFLFLLFYLKNFSAFNYVFESHDILYFGPTLEMLNANYSGHLKLFTFYPHKMAAFHMLPSSVMTSLCSLFPVPNLINIQEARYLLVIIILTSFFHSFLIFYKDKLLISTLSLIFSLVFFGEQLMYCLTISNYLYVLVFFTILRTIFFTKSNDLLIIVLCLFLVICKSSIFYSALIMYLYLIYKNKQYVFNPVNIVTAMLVFFNILSWALITPPYPNEDLSFRLLNPFNIEYGLKFSIQFKGWIMGDELVDWIKTNYISSALVPIFVALVIIKFYLPSFLGNNIARRIVQKKRKIYFLRSIEIYLVISFFGWLLIRNGFNFSHQAHGFLLALIPSLFFLSIWIINIKKNYYALLILSIFFVIYAYPNFLHIPYSFIYDKRKNNKVYRVLQYDEIKDLEVKKGFYKPKKNEEITLSSLKAVVKGQRIMAEDLPSFPKGQIRHWVRPLE